METIYKQKFSKQIEKCGLQPTDILLVHTRRSLWGWLIRLGTRCYWNHALMICSTGDDEKDYRNMLAVDAKTDGTIVIRKVSEYLKRSDKYDVAVKRLSADWFDNDIQPLAFDLRSRICNIALNEVDFKLGRRLMRYYKRIVRQMTVIYRFTRRKIRGMYTPPNLPWSIRPTQVRAFTCGGFVQWCYYKAASKMLEEKGGDHSLLDDVVFNPRAKREPTPFELLTTTPADLANCDKLSWKYIIKNGVMEEVSSSHDAELIATPV